MVHLGRRALALATCSLPWLANAQSPTSGLQELDSIARIGSQTPFFASLRAQGCQSSMITTGQQPVFWSNVQKQVGQSVRTILGGVPATPGGQQLENVELSKGENYSFRKISIQSRFSFIQTFAYVLEPTRLAGPKPVVVLLHGSGTLPQQAFNLRFNGEGGVVTRPDSTPFIGLGLALARRGFTVIAPILGTRPAYNRGLPWLEVSLWGQIFRNKTGTGGAETLLVAEIESFIDYAVGSGLAKSNQVFVAGWKEGAYLAALTASIDDRVRAVVRLGWPYDTRRYRTTTAGMFRDAGFAHADCRLGDLAQAVLLRGKPLLYTTSSDDAEERIRYPFRNAAIVDSIRAYYTSIGWRNRFAASLRTSSKKTQDSVAAWLENLARQSYVPVPIPVPRIPPSYRFPFTDVDQRANTTGGFLGDIAPCSSLLPVVAKSYPGSKQIRDTILSTLRVRDTVRGVASLMRRVPLDSSRGYLLSLVEYGQAGHPLWHAVLAEPLHASEPVRAVLSLNGIDNLDDLFAYGSPPVTPYAHGYADALARRGFVVFVPLLPAWATDAYAALSAAQTGGSSTEWNTLIREFTEAVDVLVKLRTVDTARIAAYGISFGGSAAAIVTAIEPRIKALVYNNIPIDFAPTFNRPAGAFTNIWLADACSVIDAALLAVAPRPMTWEAGEDPLVKNEGMDVISRMRERYRAFGAEAQFTFSRHTGGHETFPDALRIFGR